ncbi:hypothetical protein SAMN05216548_108180 [Faunimonas pinastri]|uniref:Uncharacterized protein n=1 Tax=Faunimonas pinastri TaxID=1855383 RepID=A0A1H9JMV9_9HYPH|nr:hypothetical protein [Faunimonas pinastri]SEQ87905.1 hypothetical protein SAMN05216548_108180 [Faunimonas pinastri]
MNPKPITGTPKRIMSGSFHPKHVTVAVVLLAALSSGACATKPADPPIRVVYQRQELPSTLLSCKAEPAVPAKPRTQKAVARYVVALADAGADCRGKVAAVRQAVVK